LIAGISPVEFYYGILSWGPLRPFFVRWKMMVTNRRLGLNSGKLTSLLQPLVEDLGYEFVGIEHSSNPKNPVLVIYIDAPDGIAVEDCAKASREIAAILDVEDPIPGKYQLEVSSPGLDRPLFTLAQFQQYSGEVAQISLFAPREGRRKFKGKILGAIDDQVRMEQDGVEVTLDLGNIAKARLVPDYAGLFAGRG
jgi:ribosome maturation factor RimP